MSQHLTQDDAAKWVSGLMEPEEALALEQHVSLCPPCETVLRREAVANEAFAKAMSTMPAATVVSLPSRRARTVSLVAVAALALAASLLLVTRVESPRQTPVDDGLAFTVIDAGDDNDGFMRVPRYEEGHALPAIALTAVEPFPL